MDAFNSSSDDVVQRGTLLIVDDDERFAVRLSKAMEKRGFEVSEALSLSDAKEALRGFTPDYAVVDLRLGELIMLQALHNAPTGAVGGQRETADQALVDAVAAVAADGRAEYRARGRWRDDALERIEGGVGGRCGTGRATSLNHSGAPLLDRFEEVLVQPSVIPDHLRRRLAADAASLACQALGTFTVTFTSLTATFFRVGAWLVR